MGHLPTTPKIQREISKEVNPLFSEIENWGTESDTSVCDRVSLRVMAPIATVCEDQQSASAEMSSAAAASNGLDGESKKSLLFVLENLK